MKNDVTQSTAALGALLQDIVDRLDRLEASILSRASNPPKLSDSPKPHAKASKVRATERPLPKRLLLMSSIVLEHLVKNLEGSSAITIARENGKSESAVRNCLNQMTKHLTFLEVTPAYRRVNNYKIRKGDLPIAQKWLRDNKPTDQPKTHPISVGQDAPEGGKPRAHIRLDASGMYVLKLPDGTVVKSGSRRHLVREYGGVFKFVEVSEAKQKCLQDN